VHFEANRIVFAFGLTLLAGLATGVGSALAFFVRRTSFRFLSVSLGFSGGVMLYVSFVEILAKAERTLTAAFGENAGAWAAAGSFFLGALLIGLIDLLTPQKSNPHEVRSVEALAALSMAAADRPASVASDRLLKMGVFSALAIAIHNFPEGIATFLAALDHPRVGVAIAIAVALHNVPEGISVSVPIYFATGRRRKAFALSFLSGLGEPLGAALVFALLGHAISPAVMGVAFGAVSGIMVYISLDELLPTAREYGRPHEVLLGLFAGMAVMAASLVLLR
jgi:ZIP family zinc transporter